MNETQTDTDTEQPPIFPTEAPPVFADPAATRALFDTVLGQLATVVDVPDGQASAPTPCRDFDVAGLQQHVLAWLQFFAQALDDPTGAGGRLDPETWALGDGQSAAEVVEGAAAKLDRAVEGGAAGEIVTMSQARMAGDGVLAMALGEYLVHGWDLATATGRPWFAAGADDPAADAAGAALAFLEKMVQPEYRGEDSGFFGDEVTAPDGATTFERLLCFAGRDPGWQAP